MANLEKILPCPFCGGPATIEEVEGGVRLCARWNAMEVTPCATCGGYCGQCGGPAYERTGVVFSVGCAADEADCMGYQSLTTFSRRSDAIRAWNRRAPVQVDGEV